ncbi:MAG: sugar ABC transporter permease [Clostridia bacterium]|nr:sugar ABC transporter permease [Clostridia bacterium]
MKGRKLAFLPFLLPGLAGLTAFYIVPFAGGVFHSLTDGSFENAFVGMNNYLSVWQNQMFLLGLKNTMFFSCACTPMVFAISFLLAFALNRMKKGGGLFRSVMLIPYLMPSSAVILPFLILFDYGGYVNRVVEALGFDRVAWLTGAAMRTPVILLFVWKNLGFSVVIFLAAMQTVPEPLYEYAKLDGAGFIKQAWHVTMPMIVPGAFLVLVMCWINSFKIFKEVYFIGGAYPDESLYTLQNYMNNMFSRLNYQLVTTAAYSFAIIVFAIFAALFLAQKRLQRRLEV